MDARDRHVIDDVEVGRLNALVKNVMAAMEIADHHEAIRRVNAGEWVVVEWEPRWREEEEVIYLTVTSDGTTGPDWINRFADRKRGVSGYARMILDSPCFVTTSGVTSEIAILKSSLFGKAGPTNYDARAEGDRRNQRAPTPEIACLLRYGFTDYEMGRMGLSRIVVMHEPLMARVNDPRVLLVLETFDRNESLIACPGREEYQWGRDTGFAFEVAPKKS